MYSFQSIVSLSIYIFLNLSCYCKRALTVKSSSRNPLSLWGVSLVDVSRQTHRCVIQVSWLLWIYLYVMFLLIVLLLCFMILAFVVTNKSAGEVLSYKGYKEYKLGDYSNWLHKRANNNKTWNKTKSCLMNSYVCNSLMVWVSTIYHHDNMTEFSLHFYNWVLLENY
uniref:Uncharacterized protein n=1 Tax=Nelumbo nucifera TaxID=4432 RepID=A0A822YMC9_NELNU|nr:TPA_asm: hypothetical protein HUJ06_011016 [Nelumbo nucifera]